MLQYVTELFKNIYRNQIDDVICDGYVPSDGEYLIVEENENSFEIKDTINIKQDKKTKEIDRSSKYFDFICKADYFSKLLDMNKPVDGKKVIHSNNYLSFFVKKDSNNTGKLTNEIIHNYYEMLRNPRNKYTKDKEKLAMYEELEEKLGKSNKEKVDRIENWILNNIYDLVPKDSKEKTYLKIFFKYDIAEYEKESKKYIVPNIYNSTDYNITVNDITLGLPNDNMGMNSKKPYLENKSRKTKIPFLLSSEEVLLQKKFFDYLMNMACRGKVNIYMNEKEIKPLSNKEILKDEFTGIYMRIKKGKEVEILDFDVIQDYKPNKKKPLKLRNILKVINKKTDSPIIYDDIYSLKCIKDIINNVFFSKFLDGNYFKDSKELSINNANLKRNLLLSRSALFTWFYKGNSVAVWKVLDTSSLSLIKGALINGYLIRASEQFNLRCAFKEYFEGGEEMADILKEVKESLRKKINIKHDEDTLSIENDKEYYFAVGQLTGYFISLSKSKNKTHSLANPIINARNDKRIKEELKKLYKKYNYTINYTRIRLKNLYGMISSYEPETEVNDDLIIAGYLHSNLIFEKSEKQNKDKEEKNDDNE